MPPAVDVLLVEQEVAASATLSVVEQVLQADSRREKLLREEESLSAAMEAAAVAEGGVGDAGDAMAAMSVAEGDEDWEMVEKDAATAAAEGDDEEEEEEEEEKKEQQHQSTSVVLEES